MPTIRNLVVFTGVLWATVAQGAPIQVDPQRAVQAAARYETRLPIIATQDGVRLDLINNGLGTYAEQYTDGIRATFVGITDGGGKPAGGSFFAVNCRAGTIQSRGSRGQDRPPFVRPSSPDGTYSHIIAWTCAIPAYQTGTSSK